MSFVSLTDTAGGGGLVTAIQSMYTPCNKGLEGVEAYK